MGVPGVVTLVETGLRLDDGTVLTFGEDGDMAVSALTGVLGAPDDDSGFVTTDFCAGVATRFLRWGALEVVIDRWSDDTTTFGQWDATGSRPPPGLVAIDGLGVGATVGFLEVTYGPALTIAPAVEGSPEGLFAVTNSVSGGEIVGLTTGLEPEDTVVELWAGDSCPRVFT
ncbi:MAG: hypothetical protein D6683_16510 [Actinomyces sp.]|nr:MAG: hypothetical protein D6683_16510 [Actinomyces sp.]